MSNKGMKFKQKPHVDHWANVPLKRGKLTGMLTDELAKSIWPDGNLKQSTSGFSVVSPKEMGRKMPIKSS